MRLMAICGSGRNSSRARRSLEIAAQSASSCGAIVDYYDLWENPLPFYDGQRHIPGICPAVDDLRQRTQQSDALLISSPEYHSGYSGAIKNLIDLLEKEQLAGKIIGLIGIAGGRFGAAASLAGLSQVFRSAGAFVLPLQVSLTGADWDYSAPCPPEFQERLTRLGMQIMRAGSIMAALRQSWTNHTPTSSLLSAADDDPYELERASTQGDIWTAFTAQSMLEDTTPTTFRPPREGERRASASLSAQALLSRFSGSSTVQSEVTSQIIQASAGISPRTGGSTAMSSSQETTSINQQKNTQQPANDQMVAHPQQQLPIAQIGPVQAPVPARSTSLGAKILYAARRHPMLTLLLAGILYGILEPWVIEPPLARLHLWSTVPFMYIYWFFLIYVLFFLVPLRILERSTRVKIIGIYSIAIVEDCFYWVAKHFPHYPFPAPNWYQHWFPGFAFLGQPFPIIQVPIHYVIATLLLIIPWRLGVFKRGAAPRPKQKG